MRADFKIAIVLAVAALPAGAALMAAPEYLHLSHSGLAVTFWGGIALAAILLLLALAIALRGEAQMPAKGHRRRMTAILGMAFCAISFMAFALLFFVSSRVDDIPPHPQQWSWSWDPLTSEQKNRIIAALKAVPPQTIEVACSQNAGPLCDSLLEIFSELKWPRQTSSNRGQVFTRGITGLAFEETSDATQQVKSALEKNTDMKVAFVKTLLPVRRPHLTLFVGAKPLPEPMPDSIKNQLAAMGAKFKRLSADVGRLSVDRAREESLLPVLQDQSGIANWRRAQQFRQETQILFNERFGSTAANYLQELSSVGIEFPFHFDSSDVAVVSRWFGAIGQLLEEAKVPEARQLAVDNNWR